MLTEIEDKLLGVFIKFELEQKSVSLLINQLEQELKSGYQRIERQEEMIKVISIQMQKLSITVGRQNQSQQQLVNCWNSYQRLSKD